MFVKKEEGGIKSEGDTADENFGPCPLWKGNILLQQERSKSLRVAVKIFHQDDSKGTLQLFDWTHGTNTDDEITLHECFPFQVCPRLQSKNTQWQSWGESPSRV